MNSSIFKTIFVLLVVNLVKNAFEVESKKFERNKHGLQKPSYKNFNGGLVENHYFRRPFRTKREVTSLSKTSISDRATSGSNSKRADPVVSNDPLISSNLSDLDVEETFWPFNSWSNWYSRRNLEPVMYSGSVPIIRRRPIRRRPLVRRRGWWPSGWAN